MLSVGASTCLTPLVLVDVFGLEKLSNALGFNLLFAGVGAIAGPPFAGLSDDVFVFLKGTLRVCLGYHTLSTKKPDKVQHKFSYD